ncbi:MAG: hypothetical protein JXJ19_04410 [Elusimicrobia bacterium]|nr:hypothetical protein [Elusimicrobiota bacterium]
MKKILTILLLITAFTAVSCQQKNLANYSTPEATYRTYIEQAKTLRIVADQRNYRRAIRCFTDEDWKWFAKNFDRIQCDKEDFLYSRLYKTKKQAYVFGRSVVLFGPDPELTVYQFAEEGDNKAVLNVEGYPGTINFVKTKRGWRIVGLFGARDKTVD